MSSEDYKRKAAAAALEFVEPGMRLGLGTGSTAKHFVELLADRVRAGLDVVGVATSETTRADAERLGVPLTTLDETPELDLTVDGADEIAPDLTLIKGGGGALLHEKIVAAASRRLAIVVDGSKLVDRLGARTPIPVEVVTFGLEATGAALESIGARPRLRQSATGEPFITDSGNRILDCNFGPIADPATLEERIKRVVGVVENGLFIGRASVVFVADASGVHCLETTATRRGM